MKSVWIVDDDQSIRWVLEKSLAREMIPFKSFSNPNDALDALEKEQPQVVISDIRMPRGNGITLLQQLKHDYPKLPVIIMTAFSDMDSAVASLKGGAFEYITKPFDISAVMAVLQRAIAESKSAEVIKTQFAPNIGSASKSIVPELIGQAPAMQEIFRAVGRLSSSNATILITGESGTGKELLARALHKHGSRSNHPFIELNLAAMPKDMIEAELFGYERGAFANSATMKRGLFEQADGGTLFLDEVADMPLHLQSTLLQLLENGKFYRLGGNAQLQSNVRIIASSYQNLENLVASGQFREDLFHRLNVIRLRLPALRDRVEDIPILTQHFLTMSARQLNVKSKILLPETVEAISKLPYPGNVRQLQSICHWLTVMISAPEIMPHDLPKELTYPPPLSKQPFQYAGDVVAPQSTAHSMSDAASHGVPIPRVNWDHQLGMIAKKMLEEGKENVFQHLLNQFEKAVIEAALETTRGRKVEAAERLGIGRNTITRKLNELGIE
jgi:two-component system, NtrC family, nitrogen regulation response regulator GlnG